MASLYNNEDRLEIEMSCRIAYLSCKNKSIFEIIATPIYNLQSIFFSAVNNLYHIFSILK